MFQHVFHFKKNLADHEWETWKRIAKDLGVIVVAFPILSQGNFFFSKIDYPGTELSAWSKMVIHHLGAIS